MVVAEYPTLGVEDLAEGGLGLRPSALAGNDVTTAWSKVPPLPSGVTALVGLTNRLPVVADCVWAAVVAGQAIRLQGREPRVLAAAR